MRDGRIKKYVLDKYLTRNNSSPFNEARFQQFETASGHARARLFLKSLLKHKAYDRKVFVYNTDEYISNILLLIYDFHNMALCEDTFYTDDDRFKDLQGLSKIEKLEYFLNQFDKRVAKSNKCSAIHVSHEENRLYSKRGLFNLPQPFNNSYEDICEYSNYLLNYSNEDYEDCLFALKMLIINDGLQLYSNFYYVLRNNIVRKYNYFDINISKYLRDNTTSLDDYSLILNDYKLYKILPKCIEIFNRYINDIRFINDDDKHFLFHLSLVMLYIRAIFHPCISIVDDFYDITEDERDLIKKSFVKYKHIIDSTLYLYLIKFSILKDEDGIAFLIDSIYNEQTRITMMNDQNDMVEIYQSYFGMYSRKEGHKKYDKIISKIRAIANMEWSYGSNLFHREMLKEFKDKKRYPEYEQYFKKILKNGKKINQERGFEKQLIKALREDAKQYGKVSGYTILENMCFIAEAKWQNEDDPPSIEVMITFLEAKEMYTRFLAEGGSKVILHNALKEVDAKRSGSLG